MANFSALPLAAASCAFYSVNINHTLVESDLKATYHPVPTTKQPDVWETLRVNLPQGGFPASDQLDAAFTSAKIKTKAFQAENAPVVVINAPASNLQRRAKLAGMTDVREKGPQVLRELRLIKCR